MITAIVIITMTVKIYTIIINYESITNVFDVYTHDFPFALQHSLYVDTTDMHIHACYIHLHCDETILSKNLRPYKVPL